jgi:integrase
MPRPSRTGHVIKRCRCAQWKTCAHAWHLDYQRDNIRYRDDLDALIGRHAADYAEAKDEARRAIVAKLEGRDPRGIVPSDNPSLAAALETYLAHKQRHIAPSTAANERYQVAPITRLVVQGRPFGAWRLAEIGRDALDEFQRKRPVVGGNRNLALLRALFNWAVVEQLVPQTPFKVGNVSVVKLAHEAARSRRLHPGEEERVLLAAGGLRALVVAALETACRIGELLSLQWHQIRFTPRAEVFLPAQKTKAKKDRRIPMSSVLHELLEARQRDPAGELLPATAYVFGDEIGRRRRSIKTAWRLTCKRAGVTDLHFHDLRREGASRWMDAGIPLATIQRWLGHHNISQTSTYLGASLGADALEMRAYEERIGRVTHRDGSGGPNGPERDPSSSGASEKTQQNPIVH